MQRVTRQEAALRLQVSEATVDRMIKRGHLPTEKEPQGSRYRVWVLLEGDTVATPADNGVYTGDETAARMADTPEDRAETRADTGANRVHSNSHDDASLRSELARIRELADYRKQLLEDSEWRYHQLLQQLNLSQEAHLTLIRALPAAVAETLDPSTISAEPDLPTMTVEQEPEVEPPRRWRWWPF